MDQRTRKLMNMHEALYPVDGVDRLYASRSEGDRSLPVLKTALTHQYKDSKTTSKSTEEDWLKPPETILTTLRPTEWQYLESKMGRKQLYGRFKRLISNISHEKTSACLRKSDLKRETESLLIASQNISIRNNHMKARIDKTQI